MTERYRYGATKQEWDWAQHIAGADLLCSVGDMEILNDPRTRFTGQAAKQLVEKRCDISKHPSLVYQDADGHTTVAYNKGWNDQITTPFKIKEWSSDPALNCLVHCRNLRAFDVDIEDPALAARIEHLIFDSLGMFLPTRFRANSAKRAYWFYAHPTIHMPRKVLELRLNETTQKMEQIEFRGNNCEQVMFGTHPSGARLEWRYHLQGIPVIPVEELVKVWDSIRRLFPSKKNDLKPLIDSEDQRKSFLRDLNRGEKQEGDPVGDFLEATNQIRGLVSPGKYALICPRHKQHNSGDGVSDTVWESPSDEYPLGYFKCFHNSCNEDFDTLKFLEESGYNRWLAGSKFTEQAVAQAQAATQPGANLIPTSQPSQSQAIAALSKGTVAEYNPGLGIRRDGKGAMKKQFCNLADIARSDSSAFKVKLDTFKQNTAIAYGGSDEYHEITDNDLSKVREIVERRYDVSYSAADAAAALASAAADHSYDSALQWISEQTHDGVDRISRFAPDILKTEHTPYTHAVSWYLWVAMVGRAMALDGVKADMVVTIISPGQGTGKSSLIKSLAPDELWTTRIDMSKSDDDIARLLRGKVVVELPELIGFHARSNEGMKSFLDREREHHVPKYKEFSTSFARRCIFIGSHNKYRYLTDPTGNRRHLPLRVAETDQFLDWPRLQQELGQYWAQARDYIAQFPTILAAVETASAHALSLAHEAQLNATILDPWYRAITGFVNRQAPGSVVQLEAIATGLMTGGLASLDFQRAARVRNVMTMARYKDHGPDAWLVPDFKI